MNNPIEVFKLVNLTKQLLEKHEQNYYCESFILENEEYEFQYHWNDMSFGIKSLPFWHTVFSFRDNKMPKYHKNHTHINFSKLHSDILYTVGDNGYNVNIGEIMSPNQETQFKIELLYPEELKIAIDNYYQYKDDYGSISLISEIDSALFNYETLYKILKFNYENILSTYNVG